MDDSRSDTPRKYTPKQLRLLKQLGVAERNQRRADLLSAEAGHVPAELQALLRDLDTTVRAEVGVIGGLRFLDDLWSGKYADIVVRQSTIEDLAYICQVATNRKQAIGHALSRWTPPSGSPADEARQFVQQVWAGATSHIPEAFLIETDLRGRVAALQAQSLTTKEERVAAVNQALAVDPAVLDAERTAITEAISRGSLKPAELTAFFYDTAALPITAAQSKAMQLAFDAVIARAQRIRDLGGSSDDVKASLQHIPEQFWPASLIDQIQAWRKVEREMREVRVAKMFAKPNKVTLLEGFNTVVGAASLIGDLASLFGSANGLYKNMEALAIELNALAQANPDLSVDALLTQPATASGFADTMKPLLGSLEAFKSMTKALPPFAKAADTGDFSAVTDAEYVALAGKLVEFVSKFGMVADGTTFAASVCPILGAIASGIDLAVCLNAVKDIYRERGVAVDQLERFETEFWSGQQTDPALLAALKNEKKSKDQQFTKKSIEAGSKAVQTAGDISKSTGADHGAGFAIKIVGKTIELGNKVVFSMIDWNHANDAMDTLFRAQAGDPIARAEIIGNCHLYAKMYICVLAREKHPAAHEFIVSRGLTEGDLSTSQSLKILSDKLMKKAEQKDDRASTHLGDLLIEDLIHKDARKIVGAIGDTAKSGYDKAGDKIRRSRTPAYTPGQALPPPALTQASWADAKKQACANGLYDEATGIGDALGPIDALLKRAEALLKSASAGPSQADEARKHVLRTLDALAKLEDRIRACTPLTGDRQVHVEMVDFLAKLRSQSAERRTALRTRLFTDRLLRDDWQPPHDRIDSAAQWQANWDSLIAQCDVSKSDGGTGDAYKAYFKASQKLQDAATGTPSDRRKASLEQAEAIEQLSRSLEQARKLTLEIPTVAPWLARLLEALVATSQKLHSTLSLEPLDDGELVQLLDQKTFAAAAFADVLRRARKAGLVGSSDEGLSNALQKFEASDKAVLGAQTVSGARRVELIAQLGDVAKAATRLAAGNADTHRSVLAYLDSIKLQARARAADQRQTMNDVAVPAGTVSLDVADWTRFHDGAARLSAIPDATDTHEALRRRLKAVATAQSDFDKVSQQLTRQRRDAAQELSAQLAKLDREMTALRNTPGFGHPAVTLHLDGMDPLRRDAVAVVGKVLKGDFTGPPDFKARFEWSREAWQDFKKQAIDCGAMPDKPTQLGTALSRADKAYGDWTFARKGQGDYSGIFAKSPAGINKMAQQAVLQMESLLGATAALRKSCQHPTVLDYLDQCDTKCKDFIAELKRRVAV